jgi:hypothetical protein
MDGRPLDGITLTLRRRGSSGIGTDQLRRLNGFERVNLDQPVKTDGEGQFELPTLLPGRDYSLRWEGDGVEPGGSGWLTEESLVADLESGLELTAIARRPFFGRLLGSDGEPIAEAEVRTRWQADAPKTNERGEFRLAFVSELREPLVVRHPDGTYHWVLAGGEEGWADVVMDWKAPETNARRTLPSGSTLRSLAADLQARTVEAAIRHRHYIEFRMGLIELARIDLAASLAILERSEIIEWFNAVTPAHFHDQVSCGVGVCYDEIIKEGVDLREYVGVQLRLVADPESEEARRNFEALVTGLPRYLFFRLRLGSGFMAVPTAKELSRKSLTPLERARLEVAEAPSLERYREVRVYLRVACSLLDEGHGEEAAAVMAKAQAIVAPGQTPSYLSDEYIRALCRFDLEAGLELIRMKKTRDRYRELMVQVVRLVAESPEVAIGLLHEAEAIPLPRYGSFRSRGEVHKFVYGLSATNPRAAESLALKYDPTGYSLGLVALGLARRKGAANPEESLKKNRELLDAAYHSASQEANARRRSQVAASLLVVACEVDPLGAMTWLGRTLWMSEPARDVMAGDCEIAWSMRTLAPELAQSLAFSAARRTSCGGILPSDAWGVASWFNPVRTAELAIHEGGSALEEAAQAFLNVPVGPTSMDGTSVGCWWPKR